MTTIEYYIMKGSYGEEVKSNFLMQCSREETFEKLSEIIPKKYVKIFMEILAFAYDQGSKDAYEFANEFYIEGSDIQAIIEDEGKFNQLRNEEEYESY